MTQRKHLLSVIALLGIVITLLNPTRSQKRSREQWGAMPVMVSHQNGKWTIAGKKNLSRQQTERRQAPVGPHAQGQHLFARGPCASGLGRQHEEELLLAQPVLSPRQATGP